MTSVDDKPRNLRTMISEAKDSCELMIDLAYASVYFGDPQMADEVDELEDRLNDLVHDMRAVCVLAARSPRDADSMASVLKVISSIERMGHAAVDISGIVSHRVGIPRELVVDLSEAEEVSHRVSLREGSHFAHRLLSDFELPVAVGMRVVAIHRGRDWITDVGGDEVLLPGDVLFLHGAPAGISRLHQLAGAPSWEPPAPPEERSASDLDRAVDVLVEMKNISTTCVGLAWSALVLRDAGLAAEVNHLEDRLDEMKERLETWVLRSAPAAVDPSSLRGLLHLAQAAEDLGDSAQQMVWLIENSEEVHPVLSLALGDADEVLVRLPVGAGSRVEGVSLAQLHLDIDPGFHVLAIRRGGRYVYRPRGAEVLRADDELIASGPGEGERMLAELCGWLLVDDAETGEDVLVPVGNTR